MAIKTPRLSGAVRNGLSAIIKIQLQQKKHGRDTVLFFSGSHYSVIKLSEMSEVFQRIQFVIPECFYRESRIQKINILWIPAFAGMTIYSGF
jgi:hypothetical protein